MLQIWRSHSNFSSLQVARPYGGRMMRALSPSFVLFFVFVAASFSVPASVAAAPEETGDYIVVFDDSVDHPGTLAHAQVNESEGEMTAFFRRVLDGYAATLPVDQVDDIRRDPEVDYVTIDHQVGVLEEEVNLETINNGGIEIFEATIPTGVQRSFASANKALSIDGVDNLRADVDVAVIDTGIDYEHPDLSVAGRTICTSGTCVDNSGKDGHSHGTHVAGTIGAIDNGTGVVGVAPGARMWGVKVLSDAGFGQESWIIRGVEWVTARASTIEVANMSLGCACSMPALDTAINKSIEAGVVYSVAAGNSNSNASSFSPASNPNVITVSAVADYDGKPGAKAAFTCQNYGLDDRKASFSNYGTGVDVAAPGVCTVSTAPGNTYGTKSGTSMASPHVAGAAAILAALKNPGSKSDVEGIRKTIVAAGNSEWTDTSPDGVKEPLLDLSNETTFTLKPPPPTNLIPPSLSPPTPHLGVSASSTNGTWTGSPTAFKYQWKRCNLSGLECVAISGATSSTYTPVVADLEHTLLVTVTAENGGGATAASSVASYEVRYSGQITAYSLPTGTYPQRIISGPEKALWFTSSTKIGRITTIGTITEFSLPSGSGARGITEGPEGNLWFAEYGSNKIGKMTTSGTITEYALPAASRPMSITRGPDGNLWFTESGTRTVGKITPAGSITEYNNGYAPRPHTIVAGPDGKLWFTSNYGDSIFNVTTSGTFTEYSLPVNSFPTGITVGPENNLWFAQRGTGGNRIGKITTSGAITQYATLPTSSGAEQIVTGTDGNLWFTEENTGKVARITTSGSVTEYSTGGGPLGIATGPDGNIWFTNYDNMKIEKITP